MRHSTRWAACAALVLLSLGCSEPPRLTGPTPALPEQAVGQFDELRVTEAGFSSDDEWLGPLCIVTATATKDGYETANVVNCSALGREYEPGYACTGTARYASNRWTLDLHGPGSCEHWNGPHWRAARGEPPPTPAVPETDAAFVAALSQLDTLHPSEARCPVALRVPAEEAATSDSPGAHALQWERDGAELAVIRADVGEPLPTRPDGGARYQAVYARDTHVEPELTQSGLSFRRGFSHGTAYLVDTSVERVVCMGEIAARNGDAIRGRTDAHARFWLQAQLRAAEQRAITLGLRALAE